MGLNRARVPKPEPVMGGFTQGGTSGLPLWIMRAMIKITDSWDF